VTGKRKPPMVEGGTSPEEDLKKKKYDNIGNFRGYSPIYFGFHKERESL